MESWIGKISALPSTTSAERAAKPYVIQKQPI